MPRIYKPLSDQHKKKLSIALKGKKGFWKGKKQPKEMVEKRRVKNTGKKRPLEGIEKTSIANKGRKHTKESKKKISISHLGKKRSKESCKKQSDSLLGRKRPSFSEQWKRNMSLVRLGKKAWKETKEKLSISHLGKNSKEKHWNWKNGITSENQKIKNSIKYITWRKSIFNRDLYTCSKYKIKGGKLIAHHINNFADFPELRFDINNGITLSEKAHKEFHKKYGKKNNTREQLLEFLNNN